MHRSPKSSRLAAWLVMVLALALGTALPAAGETGPMSAESDHARLDALGLDSDLHAAVSLRCHGKIADDGPSVGCQWRHHGDADVRTWQVWNLQVKPEAGVRNLVAEVGADVQSIRDTNVVAPAKYLYAVIGLNGDGEIVARSRVAAVSLRERPDRDIEHLRLECHGAQSDTGPVVGCEWTPVEKANAVEYHLYRRQAHGERVLVAVTGLDVTSARDDSVETGVRYRYHVVALDADGEVVAASRGESAGVPDPERDPSDRKPHDRPSDKPSDVPVDDVAVDAAVSDQASRDEAARDEAHRDDPARDRRTHDRARDESDRPSDRVSDEARDR